MADATHQSFKAPSKTVCRLIGMQLLFTALLFAQPSQAVEETDFLASTAATILYTQDRFYQAPDYSRNPNIKGLEISEGIYLRQLSISEKRGPGFVVEKDDLSLGWNQRGLELLFKF
jgi:hypothetical protein